jgi:GAF domain-containing protein
VFVIEKEILYQNTLKQLESLLADTTYVTTNCANAAALLFEQLPQINWAGFYFAQDETLHLGPFCGKVACIRIPFGKGVCGKAAATKTTQLIEDVHQFPGHIACDSASNSEIVIPLQQDGKFYGVLDIDSPIKARFDPIDQQYLEQFAAILLANSNFAAYRFL